MAPHHHNQFALKTLREVQPDERFLPAIQCKGSDWNKTDTHSQRDEIDDKVKAVELHGGLGNRKRRKRLRSPKKP